jgi:hypothetical protein
MRRLLTCGIAVLVLSAGLLLDYAALAPAAQTSAVDVAAIQERVAELGYLPLTTVDGSLNARTRQAIIAFQGWQGLDRTGVAGPATLARLETAARPRPVAGSGSRIEIDLDPGRAPRSRADRRARDPRLYRRFRHADPDGRLPHLPKGALLVVGSVLRVAALGQLLHGRCGLPRLPGRTAVSRLPRLRAHSPLGCADCLRVRPTRSSGPSRALTVDAPVTFK